MELLGNDSLAMDAVRQALFWIAVAAALIALGDWAVRTRRVNPFGPFARFFRRWIDPLMAPVERRIVRRGGLPQHAPLWTLGIVVVGGLVLVWVLELLGGFVVQVRWATSSPGRFATQLVSWTFALLRIALIVRVISSWFQVSPYSRWIRWSFVLTEWMLAPLRRVIPTIGPVDVTPIIAFFGLLIIQGILGIR